MKLAAAAFAATATLAVLLTGCSSDDQQDAQDTANNLVSSASNAAGAAVSSVQSAAPGSQSSAASALDNAGGLFDDAKRAAFVAAYRGQFSSLAENKSDEEIEALLTSTCQKISDGQEKDAVVAGIVTEATNGGSAPSTDDAGRIYDQAKIACP